MKQIHGNLLDLKGIVCVTTNGVIRKDGKAVMGKGVAKLFADRYPQIPYTLASHLKSIGNYPVVLKKDQGDGLTLVSFPTKHNWRDNSDINLIVQSAIFLVRMANQEEWEGPIYIPTPGCGKTTGHLNWEDVQPALEPILDDRFVIVHYQ